MSVAVRRVGSTCRVVVVFFFFSSRRRHTRWPRDWSSDVCSSDLHGEGVLNGFLESEGAGADERAGSMGIRKRSGKAAPGGGVDHRRGGHRLLVAVVDGDGGAYLERSESAPVDRREDAVGLRSQTVRRASRITNPYGL